MIASVLKRFRFKQPESITQIDLVGVRDGPRDSRLPLVGSLDLIERKSHRLHLPGRPKN